ncbi:A/G-specific adenine glycosylase [Vallitalea okinawensis]|uniref:A/G-specific adenine glycosylase n=1 Tax=Vallitalea okinawensis TaxID=2078660 RepID=UPI000CFC8787|nr:A/G-specific adenine glycosylase [Vallitalea okinawensis]
MKIKNIVVGIIINERGQIFIAKAKSGEGLWEFPSCLIEEHESKIVTLKKELKKVLNLDMDDALYFFQSHYQDDDYMTKYHFYILPLGTSTREIQPTVYDEYQFITIKKLEQYTFLPETEIILPIIDKIHTFIASSHVNRFKLTFSNSLLFWYNKEQRQLPWREKRDAYSIWLSEVMLQQTQVDTVIDYYKAFINRFPSVFDLAAAEEDEVLKLWEGLGYYSRAKRLKLCAMDLVDKYNGEFPKDYAKVLKLPGIGPYTAGAVLSIAYNMALPAVDGNVLRVFSRLFNDDRDIGEQKVRKLVEEKAKELLPEDRRHFNQALMELGATTCTPKNPECEICPVSDICEAKTLNRQHLLPIKAKRVKNKKLSMEVALVWYNEHLLIMKRPTEGLLANLWGMPIVERDPNKEAGLTLIEELEDTYGLEILSIQQSGTAKHVFSHRTWEMTLFDIKVKEQLEPEYPVVNWCTDEELESYALPTAFKKLLD